MTYRRALAAMSFLCICACKPATLRPAPAEPGAPAPEWATVPTTTLGDGECWDPADAPPMPTLCEWLWSAEAMVVAEIQASRTVWEPAMRKIDIDAVAAVEPAECTTLTPAVELELSPLHYLGGPIPQEALLARFGGARVDDWDVSSEYPDTTLAFRDGVERFQPGSKVLLPLYVAPSGRYVVIERVLPQIRDGVLSVWRPEAACDDSLEFEGNGRNIEDVIVLAADCTDSPLAVELRERAMREAKWPGDGTSVTDAAQCFIPGEAPPADTGAEGEGEGEGEDATP